MEILAGLERLEREPENQQAYYDLARLCCAAGEGGVAERIFRLGMTRMGEHLTRQDFLHGLQGADLEVGPACAYFRALAAVDPLVRNQVTATGPPPDCQAILTEAWERDSITPPRSGALDPDPAAAVDGGATKRLLYIGPRHSSCHPGFMPSNVTWWVERTLAAHPGIESLVYHGDDLLYNPDELAWIDRPAERFERALADLVQCCRSFVPEIILVDGNWLPGSRSLDGQTLAAIAAEQQAVLAVHIPDFYAPLPNFAAYWGEVAQVLVLPRPDGERIAAIPGDTRLMLAPGLPFDLDFLGRNAHAEKREQVLFIGSRIRRRDMWCAFLAEAGLPIRTIFTNRTAARSISFGEYADLHGAAALTLSSGWVEGDLHVVNGRVFEAMAARSVLLLQAGGEYGDWFVPYRHYIPFATVPELLAWTRFLLARPDWRDRIADAAHDWVRSRYSGRRFWDKLLEATEPLTLT